MKKEEQIIMATKKDKLFEDCYFEGFMPAEKNNFQEKILENYEYLKRGLLENNEDYKQPIGYIVLLNKINKKIFVYQRAKRKEDYDKKELCNKWSLGLGGHIDKKDENSKNPIKESALRELCEEVEIEGKINKLKEIGYINDDSNKVGRVHFGILYLAEISGDAFFRSTEIKRGKFMSMNEIEDIRKNEIEKWSILALNELKNTM